MEKLTKQMYPWLNKRKVRAFYAPIAAPTLREGAQYLLETTGLGKMKPNVLMMGFKNNWKSAQSDQVLEYFNIIQYEK